MHDQERSESWVAEKMGISRSALNGWWTRGRTSPPEPAMLRALSAATNTAYKKVLEAALLDFGYLPEEGQAHGDTPAQKSLKDAVVKAKGREVKAPRKATKPRTRS